MTDSKITFGLVGCGSVAQYHVHALRKAKNVELVLVADIDSELARQFSERFDVPYAKTVNDLFRDPDIQAVSIATPPGTLSLLGAQAAESGKHVIVEKPMATSSSDARRLVQVCRAADVKLSVWLERRYQPFAVKARELVRAGELGRVVLVMVNTLGYKTASYWSFGFRNEGPPTSWRLDRKQSGGGVLLINTIHQLDLARFITGLSVCDVFAMTLEKPPAIETVAMVNMRCRRGELVNIISSSSAVGLGRFPIYASRDIISGTEGSLILGTPLELKHRITGSQCFDLPLLDLVDSKAAAVEDFASAILEDITPPVSPADCIEALSVILAAYESSETGQTIQLEDNE